MESVTKQELHLRSYLVNRNSDVVFQSIEKLLNFGVLLKRQQEEIQNALHKTRGPREIKTRT